MSLLHGENGEQAIIRLVRRVFEAALDGEVTHVRGFEQRPAPACTTKLRAIDRW